MLDPAPSMADLGVNPEAAALLLPHLDSFVKWELLRFFRENPDRTSTVEELARYLGRDETELKPATRALARAAILHEVPLKSECAYTLTPEDSKRQLIHQLIQGYVEDRLVRLAVASHILRARRNAAKLQVVTP